MSDSKTNLLEPQRTSNLVPTTADGTSITATSQMKKSGLQLQGLSGILGSSEQDHENDDDDVPRPHFVDRKISDANSANYELHDGSFMPFEQGVSTMTPMLSRPV